MTRKSFFLLWLLLAHFSFSQEGPFTLISWNIQDFGKTKGNAELDQMAELLRDADIVALQEVVAGYGGAQAVAKLADRLNRKGAQWDYVISDPTRSPKYVTERYAFLWKTKHIKIKDRGNLINELDAQIDREPFLLHFYMGNKQLTVINFHSRPYNKNPEAEIRALTHYIAQSITTPLLLVGDFNVAESQAVFDALKGQGHTPAVTNERTTLKRACSGGDYRNHPIDNIFFSKAIQKTESGVLDFVGHCARLEQARKLSDHLPVYLGFGF